MVNTYREMTNSQHLERHRQPSAAQAGQRLISPHSEPHFSAWWLLLLGAAFYAASYCLQRKLDSIMWSLTATHNLFKPGSPRKARDSNVYDISDAGAKAEGHITKVGVYSECATTRSLPCTAP